LVFVGLRCDFLDRLRNLLCGLPSLFCGGGGFGAGAIPLSGNGCVALEACGKEFQALREAFECLN
jgi:hypothetical protein